MDSLNPYNVFVRLLVATAVLMLPLSQATANTSSAYTAMQTDDVVEMASLLHFTSTVNENCDDYCSGPIEVDKSCPSDCVQSCATCVQSCATCVSVASHCEELYFGSAMSHTLIADQKVPFSRSSFDPPPPRL